MSTDANPEKTWGPLTPKERRILGVLIEKQKTTPDNYPMSINAIVTGSNQKSNRDPLTNYDEDDVEEILQALRKRGATTLVEGSGRVVKWKHNLYEWFDLRNKADEMAVLAELLLRGAQTIGDLRGRASRMNPIPDLPTLQAMLDFLAARGQVVYLTAPGQRGAVVTHGFYSPEELERVRKTQSMVAVNEAPPQVANQAAAASASAGLREEIATLRDELADLRETVGRLSDDLQTLKTSLGA